MCPHTFTAPHNGLGGSWPSKRPRPNTPSGSTIKTYWSTTTNALLLDERQVWVSHNVPTRSRLSQLSVTTPERGNRDWSSRKRRKTVQTQMVCVPRSFSPSSSPPPPPSSPRLPLRLTRPSNQTKGHSRHVGRNIPRVSVQSLSSLNHWSEFY